VKTLGIDLAAQPANTAACLVAWEGGRASIERVALRADDDHLTALRAGVEMTAIDSPFGWPDAFVKAVHAWRDQGRWPGAGSAELRYRLTDRHVATTLKVYPLSVSSDRIAACAWRCAGLLSQWGIADRSGREGVAEVYPAAALRCWKLPRVGPKTDPAVLHGRIGAIRAECPWLQAGDAEWNILTTNDHALDAFLSALVGRAIAIGAAGDPPPDDRPAVEGWIHLPTGDLADLV
jgi:predicted nuclease with RNAse H fold